MPQTTMYPAQPNSPQTELASAINATQTTISVLSGAVLPAAPNLLVIGGGEDAETILYTEKSGNSLTGITRGFQGTAKAWPINTKVGRFFTAYDHDAFKANIEALASDVSSASILSTQLKHGPNMVSVIGATPLNVTVQGRTLVNLLGRDGNCESLAPFTTGGGSAVTLSSTYKKSGTNSIKFTSAGTSGHIYKDFTYPLDASKQYVLAGWVYIESFTDGAFTFSLRDIGTSTARYTAAINTATSGSWQFVYVKIPTANTLVGNGFRLMFGPSTSGTNVIYFDDIRLYELPTSDYNAVGTTYTTSTTPGIDDFIPYVDSVMHLSGVSLTKVGKNLLPPFTDSGWSIHTAVVVTEPYKLTLNATATPQVSYYDLNHVSGATYTLSHASGSGSAIGVSYIDSSGAAMAGQGSPSSGWYMNAPGSRTFTPPAGCAKVRINLYSLTTGTFNFADLQVEIGSVATGFEPANSDYLYVPTTLAGSNGVYDTFDSRTGRVMRRLRQLDLDGSLSWAFDTDYTGYKRVRSGVLSPAPVVYKSLATKYDGKILANIDSLPFTGPDQIRIDLDSRAYITIADADSGWGESYTPTADEIGAYFRSKPYKLTYPLSKPIEEPVAVEGSISLHTGGNLIEVGEGVIVRERVTPQNWAASNKWFINALNPAAYTKYRNSKHLAVYRDSLLDSAWTAFVDTNNGLYGLEIPSSRYDPAAEYSVTYIALDKYALTANVTDVTAQYSGNIGTTVSKLVQDQADLATEVSVHNWVLTEDGAYIENLRRDVGDASQLQTTAKVLTPAVNEVRSGLNDHASVAATTSAAGHVRLNTATNSTSTTQAATPSAVKAAYDLASGALPMSGGVLTGDVFLDPYSTTAKSWSRAFNFRWRDAANLLKAAYLQANDTGNPYWSNGNGSAGKIWTEFNDGAGSGLDADTIDSIDSNRIVYGPDGSATNQVADFNSIEKAGFYRGMNAAHAPTSDPWNYVIHIGHDPSWGRQIGFSYNDDVQYVRRKENGNWGAWGSVGGIKKVQRGVATVAGLTNVSITAVNLDKSYVIISKDSSLGFDSGGYYPKFVEVKAELTSSTNLALSTNSAAGPSNSVAWQVIESY